MRLDGGAIVLAGLVLVVLTAAGLALLWDRIRWIARSTIVAGCVLSVLATVALQVNRLTETFPSWSALFGRPTAGAEEVDRPDEPVPPAVPASPAGPARSEIVKVTVPGPASGLTLPMYVYLPAAYQSDQAMRFPVIEALHGFPGSPRTWLNRLKIATYLDQEIESGRMAPTVVVLPYQTPEPFVDTECTDLARGPKAETYLTVDVPAYTKEHFRVRPDGRAWGLIGYSAGAYCAINLTLRHPNEFAAGASLSGYGEPGIRIGDGSEKTGNNDLWRLANLPPPPVGLYLAWAGDDHPTRRAALKLTGLAKPPLSITTAVVAHGGHNFMAWQEMEAPAFDWLSARMARPLTGPGPATRGRG